MKNPDLYFMRQAFVASTEGTCLRKKVGAVIVKNRRVICTGYNGSLPGQPHCDDPSVGCLMEDGHCVRTLHAECNSILQAARMGISVEGATLYTTASPCFYCFKLIVGVGLKRVVYGELYRDERITEFSRQCGLELADLSVPKKCGMCPACAEERVGGSCGCSGADDDGCWRCSPDIHPRPGCPQDLLYVRQKEANWVGIW